MARVHTFIQNWTTVVTKVPNDPLQEPPLVHTFFSNDCNIRTPYYLYIKIILKSTTKFSTSLTEEVSSTSETSVQLHKNTQPQFPRTLCSHWCENSCLIYIYIKSLHYLSSFFWESCVGFVINLGTVYYVYVIHPIS